MKRLLLTFALAALVGCFPRAPIPPAVATFETGSAQVLQFLSSGAQYLPTRSARGWNVSAVGNGLVRYTSAGEAIFSEGVTVECTWAQSEANRTTVSCFPGDLAAPLLEAMARQFKRL